MKVAVRLHGVMKFYDPGFAGTIFRCPSTKNGGWWGVEMGVSLIYSQGDRTAVIDEVNLKNFCSQNNNKILSKKTRSFRVKYKISEIKSTS